ncbi:Hypothetical predicted protein [Marmota monax]|uniref:Uncharacterized protein n=1 Tax=Marmota monax TaxID=9995 RepID=A0A5E4D2I8_MARMO|nr:Hypothetical predicted protein [Marmota monax]VTJ88377.1 Hypothetical predicted protein [Marmota monax]
MRRTHFPFPPNPQGFEPASAQAQTGPEAALRVQIRPGPVTPAGWVGKDPDASPSVLAVDPGRVEKRSGGVRERIPREKPEEPRKEKRLRLGAPAGGSVAGA